MKIHRHQARTRCGVGLLECIVYIGVLFVISGLAMTALYRSWDRAKHLNRAAASIVRAMDAGERWRADIRMTKGTPQVRETGTETWLVLPQTNGEIHYHFTNETVFRLPPSGLKEQPLLTGVRECRFIFDPRERLPAWRWEIELLATQRVIRVRPMFTFQAVGSVTNTP